MPLDDSTSPQDERKVEARLIPHQHRPEDCENHDGHCSNNDRAQEIGLPLFFSSLPGLIRPDPEGTHEYKTDNDNYERQWHVQPFYLGAIINANRYRRH